jgi:hypothetical protein
VLLVVPPGIMARSRLPEAATPKTFHRVTRTRPPESARRVSTGRITTNHKHMEESHD